MTKRHPATNTTYMPVPQLVKQLRALADLLERTGANRQAKAVVNIWMDNPTPALIKHMRTVIEKK